jgi:DNA helicase-2/ATP-dependent DNA helicase PcrA
VDRLGTWASANGASIADALARLDEITDIAGAAKKKVAGFRDLMTALTPAATLPPSEAMSRILAETGYVQALEREDSAESDARVENLQELAGSIEDYEAEAEAAGEKPTLAGFLERVTLVSDVDALAAEAEEGGRVVLMTVHGAKGLEFERVLLTGMEEEMFPYKGVDPGEREELEEERRLAYVAITRARKHLVMTHTQTRQIFGTTRWNRPSRFLAELPAGVTRQEATAAMASESRTRFVDREVDREESRPAWRHPLAQSNPVPPSAGEGGRYVDHDFFVDQAPDVALRRGSRVRHERFGEGEVVRVVSMGETAVVAFFPGWGEKKILARFLKPAG